MGDEDFRQAGAWLRRYHDGEPGAPRLVSLPHAGGSASFFYPVSQRLAPFVETFAVQYPGRQDRRGERPAASIGELAEGVLRAIGDFGDGSGPLVLFGHSLGAVVAFEVARRMEQRGLPGPAALIVSGRRAPSRQVPETVHLLDDAGVLAQLVRLGGTDAGILDDPDLVQMILPAVRADYTALADYAGSAHWAGSGAGPRTLTCPIVALGGDGDPVTPVEDLLAWSEFTSGDFESEIFPGGHFYLTANAERVVDSIREVLRTRAPKTLSDSVPHAAS